jgi:hypothetical protein
MERVAKQKQKHTGIPKNIFEQMPKGSELFTLRHQTQTQRDIHYDVACRLLWLLDPISRCVIWPIDYHHETQIQRSAAVSYAKAKT